jgi:hypothetical protein
MFRGGFGVDRFGVGRFGIAVGRFGARGFDALAQLNISALGL